MGLGPVVHLRRASLSWILMSSFSGLRVWSGAVDAGNRSLPCLCLRVLLYTSLAMDCLVYFSYLITYESEQTLNDLSD